MTSIFLSSWQWGIAASQLPSSFSGRLNPWLLLLWKFSGSLKKWTRASASLRLNSSISWCVVGHCCPLQLLMGKSSLPLCRVMLETYLWDPNYAFLCRHAVAKIFTCLIRLNARDATVKGATAQNSFCNQWRKVDSLNSMFILPQI